MEAGRELDALVAEKVMGFCLHRPGFTFDLTHYERNCKRCDAMVPERVFHEQQAFKPSTDIGTAWQVVEHLAAQGWAVDISVPPEGDVEVSVLRVVTVKLSGKWYYERVGFARAPTVPLAICRAALMALGVEP